MSEHIGKTYNHLTVLKLTGYRQYPHYRARLAECQCDCGIIKEIPLTQVINNVVLSCGHTKHNSNKAKGVWPDVGAYLTRVKTRARSRNIPFKLNQQILLDLWNKQEGKCALSGLPMTISKSYTFKDRRDKPNKVGKARYIQTASLDRINPNKGYVEGNVRWTHIAPNIMRSGMTDDEFYHYIESIYNHKRSLSTVES